MLFFSQFPGVTDFFFTMEELKKALGPRKTIAGRELHVEAELYDWFLVQSSTGSAITVVYGTEVDVVLLGDQFRTFKPNKTMDVYVCFLLFTWTFP